MQAKDADYLQEMRESAWYKTFKYVIIEADTRTMEMFLGLYTFLFGYWLATTDNVTRGFFTVINFAGGRLICSLTAFTTAIFMLFAIYYKYPKFRVYGSAVATFFWVVVAWNCMKTDYKTFMGWSACIFSMSAMWILLHRTAVAK